MTTCNSSLIAAYQYDAAASLLTIVFRTNGDIRHYSNVPVELFWDFEATESKGQFFNANIKGKFSVESSGKVAPDVLAPPAMDPDTQVKPPRITEVPSSPIIPNITPEEQATLDEPARKQPAVDALTLQFRTMPSGALIRTKDDYLAVAEKLKKKVSLRDMVFNLLDPPRDAVYKAYQAIQKRQKAILDPMDESINTDKRSLQAWDAEQQRIAREAQMKAQREADEAAARDQQRRTEEMRLAIAQEAQEGGDAAAAEAILSDETIQAAPIHVFAERVVAETPAVAGLSGRKNWKVREVYDLDALILDVAAGIESIKKTGKLNGHAPSTMLEASLPALNKRAKADETENLFPGVRAWNDSGLSVKKGK